MASKRSLPGPGAASDPAPDSAKRRKTGIDSKWKADFPWLQLTEDDQGMLCKLCRKHGRRPQKVIIRRAVWVDLPCKPVIRQSLVRHNKSEAHITAVKMEADLCSFRIDGGIAMALQEGNFKLLLVP